MLLIEIVGCGRGGVRRKTTTAQPAGLLAQLSKTSPRHPAENDSLQPHSQLACRVVQRQTRRVRRLVLVRARARLNLLPPPRRRSRTPVLHHRLARLAPRAGVDGRLGQPVRLAEREGGEGGGAFARGVVCSSEQLRLAALVEDAHRVGVAVRAQKAVPPHHGVAVVVDEGAVVYVVVGGGAEAEQAEERVPGVVHLWGRRDGEARRRGAGRKAGWARNAACPEGCGGA
mmetsp:Transcript_5771/g.16752  ORF Transcript_5771/g.16752 Transcript_5771/m.16752 type:complete len:229 (-) Transcript_5771:101-787(-)